MSRRGFFVRLALGLLGGCLLTAGLLLLAVLAVLDLGPRSRYVETIGHAVAALTLYLCMGGLVLWRLKSVLQLLGYWDRNQEPPFALLLTAHAQSLRYPYGFLMDLVVVMLVVSIGTIYVEVQILGRAPVQVLMRVLLTIAFGLGVGSVASIGLRSLLCAAVLARCRQLSESTGRKLPIVAYIVSNLALISFAIVTIGSVLAFASSVRMAEGAIAYERQRWLSHIIVPRVSAVADRQVSTEVSRLTQMDGMAFLVDGAGAEIGSVPLPYDLDRDEIRGLVAQDTAFYRRDFSDLRLVLVPAGDDRFLGWAYLSDIGQAGIVRETTRMLGFFSAGALVFTISFGLAMGSDLSVVVRGLVRWLGSLAKPSEQSTVPPLPGGPLPQSMLAELDQLVQAVDRVQEQTLAHTSRLNNSIADLEDADRQRRQLMDTMIGLTAPVLPVDQGLVIVPLVGVYHVERAMHIRPSLLDGIEAQRARIAVIDLTGVTQVTEALVENLDRAAQAALLMGCQIILTGIGSGVAWSLTQMKAGSMGLVVRRSLHEGLVYARTELSLR